MKPTATSVGVEPDGKLGRQQRADLPHRRGARDRGHSADKPGMAWRSRTLPASAWVTARFRTA
jgi:hypothetical protein